MMCVAEEGYQQVAVREQTPLESTESQPEPKTTCLGLVCSRYFKSIDKCLFLHYLDYSLMSIMPLDYWCRVCIAFRAATFTKFGKRVHEFQNLSRNDPVYT